MNIEHSLLNQKLIVYLFLVDEETEEFIVNEIKFRKISKEEKEIYFSYEHEDMVEEVLTHCFEFVIPEKLIKLVKEENEISNQNLRNSMKDSNISVDWDDLVDDDKEIYVYRKVMWIIEKLVEAINISVQEPISILRIDAFIDNKYYKTIQIYDGKYFGWETGCYITKKELPIIHSIYLILLENDKNPYGIDYETDWWIIPAEYFDRYAESEFIADQLINLMIGLESLLSGPDENIEIGYRLRLRASLYMYHLVSWNPRQIQELIKGLYNSRSKIVHGNAAIWKAEQLDIKIDGEKLSLYDSVQIFREILRIMLLDAILTHSKKSKKEFIQFIDTSWQTKTEDELIKVNFHDESKM